MWKEYTVSNQIGHSSTREKGLSVRPKLAKLTPQGAAELSQSIEIHKCDFEPFRTIWKIAQSQTVYRRNETLRSTV